MATIREVAQRAGVSTMTVSRVLNNSGYGQRRSADARRVHGGGRPAIGPLAAISIASRVESAVAELGYVPNTLGLSLRFKRTQTLALVVTDITNPFFTSIALLAGNNFIAIGAYRALRDAGLCVPDDMSLVTFDNPPDHMMLKPFLTVAAQPAYEMGTRAAELLLDRLDGRAAAEPQDVQPPVEIIVRRSSGPPPTAAANFTNSGELV